MAALAESGVVFDNAYTASPLCTPARGALMTGLLPSRTQRYDNAAGFSSEIPTFAHHLRSAGLPDGARGQDALLRAGPAARLRGAADHRHLPGRLRLDARLGGPTERPHWYHDMSSVTDAGTCVRTNQLDFDDEVGYAAERGLFEHIRSGDERPFCFVVSFTHPHDPYAIPQEYWDRYRDEDVPMPSHGYDAVDHHPHEERLRDGLRHGRRRDHRRDGPRRPPRLPAVRCPTSTTTSPGCSTILRVTGRLDEHRGDPHQRPRRHAGRARPLVQDELLRGLGAGAAGGLRSRPLRAGARLVTGLDDGPAADPGGHRRRRRPVRRARGPRRRRACCRCCAASTTTARSSWRSTSPRERIAPIVMLRRGSWKLVHSPADPDQLYDLATDPLERHNRVADPEAADVLADLRAEVASAVGSRAHRHRGTHEPATPPCGRRELSDVDGRRPGTTPRRTTRPGATSATTWTSVTSRPAPATPPCGSSPSPERRRPVKGGVISGRDDAAA